MTPEHDHSSAITLEMVAELARETLLRDGEHVPTLIVDGTRQPALIQLSGLGSSHEERVQQLLSLGFNLAKQNKAGELQQAFLITEAWMSTAPGGILPDQLPSQDPKRKEVLIVSQFDARKLKGKLVLYEMKRTSDGHLLELAEFPIGERENNQSDNRLLTAFALGFHMGEMEWRCQHRLEVCTNRRDRMSPERRTAGSPAAAETHGVIGTASSGSSWVSSTGLGRPSSPARRFSLRR